MGSVWLLLHLYALCRGRVRLYIIILNIIIVDGKDWAKGVLELMWELELTLKPTKCSFGSKQVEFLGCGKSWSCSKQTSPFRSCEYSVEYWLPFFDRFPFGKKVSWIYRILSLGGLSRIRSQLPNHYLDWCKWPYRVLWWSLRCYEVYSNWSNWSSRLV